MCPQSGGNRQYSRRSTKQRSRSDCHSYFSFPSRLPHTSSSLVLLRVLVPKVKRTQLEAQHSVLVQPLEIHVHHIASKNKCRNDSTIYFFHVRSHKSIFFFGKRVMHFGIEPLFSPFLSKDTRITIFSGIIYPVVLSGCENLFLTLRKVQRLRLSENRIMFFHDSTVLMGKGVLTVDVPRSHYLTTHRTQ